MAWENGTPGAYAGEELRVFGSYYPKDFRQITRCVVLDGPQVLEAPEDLFDC
jgi:hypothetical protein